MLVRVGLILGIVASLVAILTYFQLQPSPNPSPSPSRSGTGMATVTGTPTPTATATSTPVVSPSSPGSQALSANGTKLNSYTIDLPQTDSIPLGSAKPLPSQLVQGGGGDVFYDGMIMPGPGDQMLELANDPTPTYKACKNNFLVENRASATAGTTFCVAEPGKMVGVTVDSVGTTQPYDYYLQLSVIVWKDS